MSTNLSVRRADESAADYASRSENISTYDRFGSSFRIAPSRAVIPPGFDRAPKHIEPPAPIVEPEGAKSFNYETLAPDVADAARQAVIEIRGYVRASYAEVGRVLLEIKAKLGHGAFGSWLEAEFTLTQRSAENYMNAAKFVEGKSEAVSILPPSAIYALAAPGADPTVVAEVLAEVEAGKVIPANVVRERLEVPNRARKAIENAAKAKEEKEREKRNRADRERRAERQRIEEAELAAKHQVRADEVAAFLAEKLGPDDLRRFRDLMFTNQWYRVNEALRRLDIASEPSL